ncbi:hypothetical protein NFI96_009530, partial [Prochilodus magdalenae]
MSEAVQLLRNVGSKKDRENWRADHVQWEYGGDETAYVPKPHGNAQKTQRPFVRTAPGVLHKIKEKKDLPPAQVYREMVRLEKMLFSEFQLTKYYLNEILRGHGNIGNYHLHSNKTASKLEQPSQPPVRMPSPLPISGTVSTVSDTDEATEAFNCFGEGVAITAAAAAADETVEEDSVQAIDSLNDGDDDNDGLEPAPLSALEDPCLPPHRRVKRSSKASDLVEEKLKIGFLTPNDTRWNSMYLSMQRLSHIATLTPQASDLIAPGDPAPEYDKLLLHTVCDEFGLRQFSPQEIDFIHNFVSVMHPLAAALNILQGEKNTFLGYLVPTIVQLKNDLKGLLDESSKPTATEGLAACRPLIQTMIQAICKRLDDRLEEKENILAAVLLPMFKLDWVSDDIQRLQYRVMLKQEVQSISVVETEQVQTSATERKSSASSFFKFSRSPATATKSEVDMYLDAPTANNFNEYTGLPKLKKLFV